MNEPKRDFRQPKKGGRMGGKKKGLSPEAKKKAETAATKRNLQSKLQELLEWVEQQCTDIYKKWGKNETYKLLIISSL